MPIEIREVVIKAQLDKSLSDQSNDQMITEERLQEMKGKIVSELTEKIMDKLWQKLDR